MVVFISLKMNSINSFKRDFTIQGVPKFGNENEKLGRKIISNVQL